MTLFDIDAKCDVCSRTISLYGMNGEFADDDLCSECRKAVSDAKEQREYLLAPYFELGIPCTASEFCRGILRQCINHHTGDAYYQCSACQAVVDKMPIEERLENALTVINKALNDVFDEEKEKV